MENALWSVGALWLRASLPNTQKVLLTTPAPRAGRASI
jgi:hypothetical protein